MALSESIDNEINSFNSYLIIIFVFSAKKLMDTANFMYGLPPYRFTSYSIGILIGYALRNQKPQQLTPKFLCIGWLLASLSLLLTVQLALMNNSTYSPLYMAMFSSFTPALFCLFFAWLIYVSHHESGSKHLINYFLLF